jgi:hypothetical protein
VNDLERQIRSAGRQEIFTVLRALGLSSRESVIARVQRDAKAARVVGLLLTKRKGA